MNVLTLIYAVPFGFALSLGLMHLGIWRRDRQDRAFLLASIMSFAAAIAAFSELGMSQATSTGEFQNFISINNYAICTLLVTLVWFVRARLGSGRTWLAWTITVMWLSGVVIDLVLPGSITFSSIHSLESVTTFWGETYVVANGEVNPFKIIVDLATPMIIFYTADASISAWRSGKRSLSVRLGGSIILFMVVAGTHAVLVDEGIVRTPFMVSIAFVAIMLALALDLVDDVARTAAATRGLEAQRKRWRALIEGVQLAVIRINSDGLIGDVNPFLERLLGRSAAELVGTDPIELSHPEGRTEFSKALNRGQFSSSSKGISQPIETSSGETRDVVWLSVTLQDANGDPDGFIAVGDDVTEQKKALAEVGKTRGEIEKLTRVVMLGEMASTLAHELSQPIAAALSNAQAAQLLRTTAGKAHEETDDIIEDIVYDMRRAGEIIDRVRKLMFNKEPSRDWFDLNAALEEVVKIFANDAAAKGIEIRTILPEETCSVYAARLELQQVSMNLILNAIQAMTEAGSPQKIVTITVQGDRPNVEIIFDDTGPGLSLDMTRDVLQPFVSTKNEGMGIGLAISRRIVERHSGQITYGPSPARGARFSLSLPIGEEISHAANG